MKKDRCLEMNPQTSCDTRKILVIVLVALFMLWGIMSRRHIILSRADATVMMDIRVTTQGGNGTAAFQRSNQRHSSKDVFRNETITDSKKSTGRSWFESPQSDTDLIPVCSSHARLKAIRKNCDVTGVSQLPPRRPKVIVDNEHELIYCFIPKIASSTWKIILAKSSSKGGRFKQPSNPSIHRGEVLRTYGLMETFYDHEKHSHYTKFVIIRNPFERLMSAYYQKVTLNPGHDKSGYYGSSIRKYIIQTFGETPSRKKELNTAATFKEFISMVLSGKKYSNDKHWAPFARRCAICEVNYDYVLRTESLETDSVPILNKLNGSVELLHKNTRNVQRQVSSNGTIPINKQKYIKYEKTLDLFKQLDHTMKQQLLGKYKLDFELYGYNFNRTTNKGQCMLETEEGACC